jgi:hypothetical protein
LHRAHSPEAVVAIEGEQVVRTLRGVQREFEIPAAPGPGFSQPQERSPNSAALVAGVYRKLMDTGHRRLAVPAHRRRAVGGVQRDGTDDPILDDGNEAVA